MLKQTWFIHRLFEGEISKSGVVLHWDASLLNSSYFINFPLFSPFVTKLFFLSLQRKMVPLSVLEDDSHHTMHYSQSLPYADLLDHEAEQWLNDICVNLALSVKAKDFTRGALAWVKRLSSYMDMKHAVPRETRAHLAKLLYEMIIMPGMEPALVELWSNNCIRLIRYLFTILVIVIKSTKYLSV